MMYEAKLCDPCWAKVQGQPIAPNGIQYAMRYEELCDRCKAELRKTKAVNDELRKTQENSEC